MQPWTTTFRLDVELGMWIRIKLKRGGGGEEKVFFLGCCAHVRSSRRGAGACDAGLVNCPGYFLAASRLVLFCFDMREQDPECCVRTLDLDDKWHEIWKIEGA